MSALASQQQAMLQALRGHRDDSALSGLTRQKDLLRWRGLQAYRGNAHALAERALAAAFPVMVLLLGEESFSALARAFWHDHPPQCGDMGWWGDTLPSFIAGAAQLQDEPYLPDVARVEWALHRAAFAADVQADSASLALLLETDPADLRLVLASGVCVLRSPWPVATIINAHLGGGPDLGVAGARLRAGTPEIALVWRRGFKPCMRQDEPPSADFVTALQTCPSLGAALDAAAPPDLAGWLSAAVQSGLVASACRLHANQTTGDTT